MCGKRKEGGKMKVYVYAAVILMMAMSATGTRAADPYPEAATEFAGMIGGTAKGTDDITVQVAKINTTWQHSKAQNAEALVGKQLTIKINPDLYAKKPGYVDLVRKFFGLLEVGTSHTFDVRHFDGDSLTFLELTQRQKERVEASGK
jgi:hypothetical protein